MCARQAVQSCLISLLNSPRLHIRSHHLHFALFTWPFICSLNIARSQACLQATMVGVVTISKLFSARNRDTIPPMLLLLNLHMNPILQVLFFLNYCLK